MRTGIWALVWVMSGCVAIDDREDAEPCNPNRQLCPGQQGFGGAGGTGGAGGVDGSVRVDAGAIGSCAEACGALAACAASDAQCSDLGPADEGRLQMRCVRFCEVQPAFVDAVDGARGCAGIVAVGQESIQWFAGLCPDGAGASGFEPSPPEPAPISDDCAEACDLVADCATNAETCPALGPRSFDLIREDCRSACGVRAAVADTAFRNADECYGLVTAMMDTLPGRFRARCLGSDDPCAAACWSLAECATNDEGLCRALDRSDLRELNASCFDTCVEQPALAAVVNGQDDCRSIIEFVNGASADFNQSCQGR